jgi:hypothetical protein
MCPIEKYEQLTLFPPGTREHANLSVLPGSEKAREMTATSGLKLTEYYKNSGPLGSLVRTLLGMSHWGSTMCLLTWKDKVTPHNRLLFRLQLSELRTEEIEFSLWPTPVRSDYKRRGPNSQQQGLPEIVRMFPTPTSQDAKNSTLPPSQKNRDSIPGAILRMLPTPTASQNHKPVRALAPSEANGTHGTMLVGAVGDMSPELVGGQLNPQWVEWLMGFPTGWTDLKPSETP